MRRVVLLFVVWGLVQVAASAQDENEAVELWLEKVANEFALQSQLENESAGETLVEIMEYLEQLLERPLDINRATRSQLEQIPLLSDFQIESLLEYIQNSGPVLSKTELGLINGFDKSVADILAPLFHFSSNNSNPEKGISSTLLLKGWWKPKEVEYIGAPFYSQIKYKSTINEKYQIGCTLEKDYGELITGNGQLPLGDFFSFQTQAKNLTLGKNCKISNITLGDYSIRMGQGLTSWGNSTIFSEASVQNSRKRGATITPYTSSDENSFFRGAAATAQYKLGNFSLLEGSTFISYKKIDARTDGIKYTSLPDDGLHNTESLLKTRKSMSELAYGATVAAKWKNGKAGLNWLGYGYNLHNGRKVQEYNKYQMYDGWWGNLSADAAVLVHKVTLFGELAIDYGGGLALLVGLITRLNGWDLSILGRNYAKNYIAPYANAYSTISSCSNQQGISVTFLKNISKDKKLSGGGDYTYYPWLRYNIPTPSATAKIWGKIEAISKTTAWDMKLQGNWSSHGNSCKIGANGSYALLITSWLRLRAKAAVVSYGEKDVGGYISADARIKGAKGKLTGIIQGVYYNCRKWENRLYIYEHDLPSAFSGRLLYGAGFCWYALINCKIGKIWSIYLKIDNLLKLKTGIKMRFF